MVLLIIGIPGTDGEVYALLEWPASGAGGAAVQELYIGGDFEYVGGLGGGNHFGIYSYIDDLGWKRYDLGIYTNASDSSTNNGYVSTLRIEDGTGKIIITGVNITAWTDYIRSQNDLNDRAKFVREDSLYGYFEVF